jgi:hypothetical protein
MDLSELRDPPNRLVVQLTEVVYVVCVPNTCPMLGEECWWVVVGRVVGEWARRRYVAHVGLVVVGGSGCFAVLVDESVAGGVSSYWRAGPIGDNFGRVRCALTEAAVRSMRVVVLDIFA